LALAGAGRAGIVLTVPVANGTAFLAPGLTLLRVTADAGFTGRLAAGLGLVVGMEISESVTCYGDQSAKKNTQKKEKAKSVGFLDWAVRTAGRDQNQKKGREGELRRQPGLLLQASFFKAFSDALHNSLRSVISRARESAALLFCEQRSC